MILSFIRTNLIGDHIIMKTLITLLCFFSITLQAKAQIDPGTRILGGQFGINYVTESEFWGNTKNFDASFRPTYGKFLSDKWFNEFGISYEYGRYNSVFSLQQFSETTTHANSVGATISFVRLFHIAEKLHFTLGVLNGLNYNHSIMEDSNNPAVEIWGLDLALNFGLLYQVADHWILNLQLGALGYQGTFHPTRIPDHTFGFNFSTSTTGIGVRYLINGKKATPPSQE